VVIALFLGTIVSTVLLHHFLHLPPFLGMMTGLGVLKLYGFFIRRAELRDFTVDLDGVAFNLRDHYKPAVKPFDIFISMKRVEWDTLMFFYGVILCVGGLGALGYLALVSDFLYADLGPTAANILIGVLSAVVDNIPLMFAVLSINPDMSVGQWLLITLTTGVGGSLLSIGSAAGVALMGQAREYYTFLTHLKWTWAIALGYAAAIWAHFSLNAAFDVTRPHNQRSRSSAAGLRPAGRRPTTRTGVLTPRHRIPTPRPHPQPPQTTGAASPLRAPAWAAQPPPGPPDEPVPVANPH
jgi:Na+/H+ antiporter NhaD/arsenite permease-like protein